MRCNKCGNELTNDMIYCNKCGNKIVRNEKNNVEVNKTKWGRTIIVGIIMISVIYIIIKGVSGIYNFLFVDGASTSVSIVNEYNIPEEVKEQIRNNWNKVSGYGTDNLEKVILDIEMGNLYLRYTDTTHNGLYIASEGYVSKNYGDEIYPLDNSRTYREHLENIYSNLVSMSPERYKILSSSEFEKLLSEL